MVHFVTYNKSKTSQISIKDQITETVKFMLTDESMVLEDALLGASKSRAVETLREYK